MQIDFSKNKLCLIFLTLLFGNSYAVIASDFERCSSSILATNPITSQSRLYEKLGGNINDYMQNSKTESSYSITVAHLAMMQSFYISNSFLHIGSMMRLHKSFKKDTKENKDLTMSYIKIHFNFMSTSSKQISIVLEKTIDNSLKRELVELKVQIEKDLMVHSACI